MQIFPANNIWNAPIDKLPVMANSAALVNTIGASQHLRLDDSFPINVGANIPLVNLGGIGGSDSQSDPNPYGIPDNVVIEAGSDGHALIVDTGTNVLTEIFALSGAPGSWTCGSAAKWDLGSNALRPYLFTSADAAGLPILPGLVRYEEIVAGKITHALRMTIQNASLYGYAAWPARHFSTQTPPRTDANIYSAMGQRFRLKASFDISSFSPTNQIILRALKQYGCMVADNGLPFAMQYAADPRWNAADLTALHNILGVNMEAVDATALMVTADSMAVGAQGNRVLVTDALGRQNAIGLASGLAIVNGALTITGAVATTDPPPSAPVTSLFPAFATPATFITDPTPVTLGLIFMSSVDITLKGIRFYRSLGNNGPHVGLLYSGDGMLVASAPFVNETLIGWQTALFQSPIIIKANGAPSVAAVFTASGFSVTRPDAFGGGIVNGTLRGIKSAYTYGASPAFPTLNYQDSNYWVDVLLA